MVQSEGGDAERRVRRFRSVSEKRRIVELTLEPGASVALVARAHGVNANQVFKWRRPFEIGELVEPGATASRCGSPIPVKLQIVQGGFYFHPTGEDLSVGTLDRKKPLQCVLSVYTNSENVIAFNWFTSARLLQRSPA